MGAGMDYIKLARPWQWLKNAAVLLPLFFLPVLRWGNGEILWDAVGFTVAGFCLVSSAVYCLNDVWDAEADKSHPKKKHRPIAAGNIEPVMGFFLAGVLALIGLTMGWLAGAGILVWQLIYMAVNIGYTKLLKKAAVLDVFVVGSGFWIRMQAGALALGAVLPFWLGAGGFLAALAMGFGKRKAEAGMKDAKKTRACLAQFPMETQGLLMAHCWAVALMVYGMFVASAPMEGIKAVALGASWAAAALCACRHMALVCRGEFGEDLSAELSSDGMLLGAGIACGAFAWLALWGF